MKDKLKAVSAIKKKLKVARSMPSLKKLKSAKDVPEPMPAIAKSYMADRMYTDGVDYKKDKKSDKLENSKSEGLGKDLNKVLDLKKLRKATEESVATAGMSRREHKVKSAKEYDADRKKESDRADKEGFSGHGMKKRILKDMKSLNKRKIPFDLT